MSRVRTWQDIAVPVAAKHYRRLAVLGLFLVLALSGLVARLVEIQVWKSEELRTAAERQRLRREHQTPERGQILDRNGVVLVASVLEKTIKADPNLVDGEYVRKVAECLAGPLDIPVLELTGLLSRTYQTNAQGTVSPCHYVLIQKYVPNSRWLAAQEALKQLNLREDDRPLSAEQRAELRRVKRNLTAAIQCEPIDDLVRYYPFGELAAHVLGFVAWKNDPANGVEGIELKFNSSLRGVAGMNERERVMRANESFFEEEESLSARPGLNVRLTVDARVQAIVEEVLAKGMAEIRPTSVSCVVVVPRTGEILAMANQPTYDPNRYGESTPEQRRNRAITDVHEPGSTFKPLVIGRALEEGVVSLADRIDCERGSFQYGGETLGDVHPNDILTVMDVVVKSSNIGAAKVGLMMGSDRLYRAIRSFGIGSPTGITLPGEVAGILHPVDRWSKISVAWIPMGHEVAATPLQMTMAIAAVANDGRLMAPQVVRSLEDQSGNVVRRTVPVVRGQAVSPRTAREMSLALEHVVEEGTGRRAQLAGYRVAGKTGTAQKIVNGRYVNDHHYASFVGFLPADRPQLCIGVFVDDPKVGKYGGETAAPLFRAIAEKAAAYLGIPPASNAARVSQDLAQGNTATRPAGRRLGRVEESTLLDTH